MLLVDSHCHLDRLKYTQEIPDLHSALKRAAARDVRLFLCVGVSLQSFESMQQIIEPYDAISASCGVHPLDIDSGLSADLLYKYAQSKRVVAVGETGLDYYYAPESKQAQQGCFIQQIEIATDLKKPLIIHSRDASRDTIVLLKQHGAERVGGVIHCFTGDMAMAEQALELGFYISFSGIITFRSAQQLRDIAMQLPLERLLVETDSPYLAPVPHRGESNQPAYVRVVAEQLAHLRGISLEALAQATTENYLNLFTIKEPSPLGI